MEAVAPPCAICTASMGPPPFGDGSQGDRWMLQMELQWGHRFHLGAEECHGQQSSSRFNGATAFRRWKPWSWARSVSPLIWLQWGHRLSAMEARASSESILPPQTLQWGHRLSAMEALELGPFRVAVDLASMGPPPFGDGSQGVVGVHLAAPDASMGPPPFGDGSPPTPPVPSLAAPGFNGATAFRRWKLGQGRYPQRRRDAASMGPPPFGDGSRRTNDAVTGFFDRLQWGHRLSAMEAAGTGESKTWMGLLQWGHRLSAMEACWDARTPTWAGSRFNGATAFRRWKHRRAAQRCRPFGLASMGPPPFGDGSNDGSDIKKAGIWLQWGHRLSAMEALVVHGPHHELRRLQWGHRLSAMEAVRSRRSMIAIFVLQWGHRLSAMEALVELDSGLNSPMGQWKHHSQPGASMGPPPFGDGSRGQHGRDWSLLSDHTLQWGHRLSAMEAAIFALTQTQVFGSMRYLPGVSPQSVPAACRLDTHFQEYTQCPARGAAR